MAIGDFDNDRLYSEKFIMDGAHRRGSAVQDYFTIHVEQQAPRTKNTAKERDRLVGLNETGGILIGNKKTSEQPSAIVGFFLRD